MKREALKVQFPFLASFFFKYKALTCLEEMERGFKIRTVLVHLES